MSTQLELGRIQNTDPYAPTNGGLNSANRSYRSEWGRKNPIGFGLPSEPQSGSEIGMPNITIGGFPKEEVKPAEPPAEVKAPTEKAEQ